MLWDLKDPPKLWHVYGPKDDKKPKDRRTKMWFNLKSRPKFGDKVTWDGQKVLFIDVDGFSESGKMRKIPRAMIVTEEEPWKVQKVPVTEISNPTDSIYDTLNRIEKSVNYIVSNTVTPVVLSGRDREEAT